MTAITLTNSQQQALEKLKKFIKSKKQHFRLTGYAGSGKSFLIAQFMKWLEEEKFNFVAASPTNKAAKNLEKIAKEHKLDCDVTTVAKLLGQQPELNNDTGKEEFVNGDSTIADYDVVIFDEFSMINKKNFEDIVCECYSQKTKIVYVGDSAQLPPVGEKFPIIATHIYITESADLTEIVRYDGEIAKVCEEIRTYKQFNRIMYDFKSTTDGTIEALPYQEWLETALDYFKSDKFKENTNYVRFLVWRNKTASLLNEQVRIGLYGENPPAYEIGDRLIAKTPVFRPNTENHKKKDQWKILLNSSEECEVVARPTIGIDKKYQWEFWEVPVKTDDGIVTNLRILSNAGETGRAELLKKLKTQKKWKDYYYWLKLYDNCPHAYSLTTHKAQGSSIDYCFVDILDMRKCPDLQKILYTALTRTKKKALVPCIF